MAVSSFARFAARSLRAASIWGCLLAAQVAFGNDLAIPSSIADTPSAHEQKGAPKAKTQPATKPRWSDLSPAQQNALTPLAGEWDTLDAFRKRKWLAIGNKFASMKPDEQQRVQERMRDWASLTPEQRRVARESYARAKKLNPDQKSAQWENYQQLPEEQKKKLAADAASKKHVATLPSPSAQGKNKTLPPIHSAPKPVLERSVTPQATRQSVLRHSSQPEKKDSGIGH